MLFERTYDRGLVSARLSGSRDLLNHPCTAKQRLADVSRGNAHFVSKTSGLTLCLRMSAHKQTFFCLKFNGTPWEKTDAFIFFRSIMILLTACTYSSTLRFGNSIWRRGRKRKSISLHIPSFLLWPPQGIGG